MIKTVLASYFCVRTPNILVAAAIFVSQTKHKTSAVFYVIIANCISAP